MAIWNEVLEGTLNQLLARRLAMQTGSPSPSVSPEIVPGLTLENDRPEWGWIKGELLAGARTSFAGVAAQFSYFALLNPPGSGIICTVTSSQVTPGGSASLYRIRNIAGIAGTPVTATVRDARWIPPGVVSAFPTCTCVSGTSVALAPEVPFFSGVANTRVILEEPIVLRPSSVFVVELTTANQGFTDACFLWRERAAAPGELG